MLRERARASACRSPRINSRSYLDAPRFAVGPAQLVELPVVHLGATNGLGHRHTPLQRTHRPLSVPTGNQHASGVLQEGHGVHAGVDAWFSGCGRVRVQTMGRARTPTHPSTRLPDTHTCTESQFPMRRCWVVREGKGLPRCVVAVVPALRRGLGSQAPRVERLGKMTTCRGREEGDCRPRCWQQTLAGCHLIATQLDVVTYPHLGTWDWQSPRVVDCDPRRPLGRLATAMRHLRCRRPRSPRRPHCRHGPVGSPRGQDCKTLGIAAEGQAWTGRQAGAGGCQGWGQCPQLPWGTA